MSKSEQQQGAEIMEMVNTMTPAKIARLTRDAVSITGVEPVLINVRMIAPALDMTVLFPTELAAYKYAYAFREHSTSRVRVQEAGGMPGNFMVILTPR